MIDIDRIITVSLNPAVDRLIEIEKLVPGEHQLGTELGRTPGGKGVNVSRVLAKMGVPSTATGFLGQANRNDFAEFLASDLVTDEFVMLPGRTRENVTLADKATGLDTHIRDKGLAPDSADIGTIIQKLKKLAGTNSVVVFSGSLPPALSPEQFAEMIEVCNSQGASVVVDTSGPALTAATKCKLWLAKPNAKELSELTGKELSSDDALLKAARDLQPGVQCILLSKGEGGALLLTPDECLKAVLTEPVKNILNTVGCGDTLLGVFLGGLYKKLSTADALRGAIAAASASACHPVPTGYNDTLAAAINKTIKIESL